MGYVDITVRNTWHGYNNTMQQSIQSVNESASAEDGKQQTTPHSLRGNEMVAQTCPENCFNCLYSFSSYINYMFPAW